MYFLAVMTLVMLRLTSPLFAQNRGQPAAAAQPTPRWPNGKVNLGATPGEKGIWLPGTGTAIRNQLAVDSGDPNAPNPFLGIKPKISEVPFQPWARALYEYRRFNELEPHTRCKPSGGARALLTPYGVEIVEMPELQRIYVLDVGGPHTFRTIYLDGRPHPKDLQPSYYGHSVGHWEGDRLVVDTIGFSEAFWFDRYGSPHTERLHLIEVFTRTDMDTLKYEITIEDPGAYTEIWKSGFSMRWTPGQEVFEYICQDNNFGAGLMVGQSESVDRSSPIIP